MVNKPDDNGQYTPLVKSSEFDLDQKKSPQKTIFVPHKAPFWNSFNQNLHDIYNLKNILMNKRLILRLYHPAFIGKSSYRLPLRN